MIEAADTILNYFMLAVALCFVATAIVMAAIAAIRRIERSLGNTIHEHMRCTFHHEITMMFPGRSLKKAYDELSSIYLLRIRVSRSISSRAYWMHCYALLRSEREYYTSSDFAAKLWTDKEHFINSLTRKVSHEYSS
jgi:hypothetical protein